MNWVEHDLIVLTAVTVLVTLKALSLRRRIERKMVEIQALGMSRPPTPEALTRLYVAVGLGVAAFLILHWA